MALQPGTRLGAYEVIALLGAGGMGQVYRARDSRLDRDVALKVLPDSFAVDGDRVMRFTREAKTLAALNHPHIAHVYDAGQDRALCYIAMELAAGEDLAARLSRGPIPIREALSLARQIADALAAAHEVGVVHRDLKPANVIVRDDGTVKVLDFGLAKSMDAAAGSGSQPSSPAAVATMTSPAMTQMGMILGTAAYMAPEQAKGKSVDRRADVWAFGVVLYEMLSGAQPFGRDDVSDTLAAVLTHEPDLAKLPAGTPAGVRRLLARCLAKDRTARLDSMVAARLDIEDALRGDDAGVLTSPAPRSWRGVAVAAAIALATFALGWFASTLRPSSRPAASPVLFAEIAAPPDALSSFHDGFAFSPDGETFAFAARDRTGARQIWTRRLNAAAAQPVSGTEGGRYPFWSPDGRQLAFFVDGRLRRVDAAGGPPQAICDAPGLFPGGSWGARDIILFGTSFGPDARVFKVPASGGTPQAIEALGRATRPVWLPDGSRFLYSHWPKDTAEVRLASIDGGESSPVIDLRTFEPAFAFAAPGYFFWNSNDALMAQRFDVGAGTLTGSPVTLAGAGGLPKAWFAVSSAAHRFAAFVRRSPDESGSPGDPPARLQWVGRDGEMAGALGPSGRYWTLRLAPDGQRAAVNMGSELWVLDPRGRHLRVLAAPTGDEGIGLSWSPNGAEIVYRQGPAKRQRAEPGAQSSVLEGAEGLPTDWSRDGRWLVVTTGTTTADIGVYDLQAKSMRPWLATPFDERHARFSPDGTAVAYTSNATGRFEVYVRRFDGTGAAVPVSSSGGQHPIWRGDGRELFFLGADGAIMAADVAVTSDAIEPGRPRALFRIPLNDLTTDFFSPYDVAPDGQRFLLNVPDRPEPVMFLQGLDRIIK